MLNAALSVAYLNIKLDAGQFNETLELATRVIDFSGEQSGGAGLMSISPSTNATAIRGTARWAMGSPTWRDDFAKAYETAAAIPLALRSGTFWIVYVFAIPNGVLLPDDNACAEIMQIDSAAKSFGEQIAIDMARTARGITLAYRGGPDRDIGFEILEESRDAGRQSRYTVPGNLPVVDIHVARERSRRGDCDGAIELARRVFDGYLRDPGLLWVAMSAATLVESLLQRRSEADLREARATIDKLAAVPVEPGVVLNEIWLLRLRALLAEAERDEAAYRDHRDRYRKMANDLGFEGHMQWAAEML
jgi:adenylate cyclase